MKNETYYFFWVWIPLIVFTYSFSDHGSIDFQLHDTYMVTPYSSVTLVACFTLAIIGIVYCFFCNYKLVYFLNFIHTFFTLSTILGLFLFITIGINTHNGQYLVSATINNTTILIILGFAVAQVLLLINVLIALLRGRQSEVY